MATTEHVLKNNRFKFRLTSADFKGNTMEYGHVQLVYY